jgi:hypothetical protein
MSTTPIDYMVYYCQAWFKYALGSNQLQPWRGSVIAFFEQTWFWWWLLAALIILRWFHSFSSRPAGNRAALDEEQAAALLSAKRHSERGNRKTFAA